MKYCITLSLIPLLLASLTTAQAEGPDGILANPSFEDTAKAGDRPKGWQVFTTPSDVKGAFFISDGQEGEETHTGAAALLFSFPDAPAVAQALWMALPKYGGAEISSGDYTCSFWIRGKNIPPGFHTWVSLVGYNGEGERVDELARSDYIDVDRFNGSEWTQVSFPFTIPADSPVVLVAPSVIFKSQPSGDPFPVPGDLRVMVDDLQIQKK